MTRDWIITQFQNFLNYLSTLFIRHYDTMPSNEVLMAMPNNTKFYCHGFYNRKDGYGGYYEVTNQATQCALVISNNPLRYLVALDQRGYFADELDVVRYGVRTVPMNVTIDWATVTPQDVYADTNSDIMNRLLSSANNNYPPRNHSTIIFPVGKFFFRDPIQLSGKDLGIRGVSEPYYLQNDELIRSHGWTSGTVLCFPFLTNEQVAVTTTSGNMSNFAVVGNPLTYNIAINRNAVNTPNVNMVTETIAEASGEEVHCTGILRRNQGQVNNVLVMYFYNGFVNHSSNAYITNVCASRCRIGVSVGSDVQLKGVYGWGVHTLLEMEGDISEAHNVRVDSCVNAVNIIKGKGIRLFGVDGDFCVEAILKMGKPNTDGGEIWNGYFVGIGGRANCKHCYSTTDNPNGLDVREIADTSEYGMVRVQGNVSFCNNLIELVETGGANPLDVSSGVKTPNIIFTVASNQYSHDNIFTVNGMEFIKSADDIKKVFQSKARGSASYQYSLARINTARGTYYYRDTEVDKEVTQSELETYVEELLNRENGNDTN